MSNDSEVTNKKEQQAVVNCARSDAGNTLPSIGSSTGSSGSLSLLVEREHHRQQKTQQNVCEKENTVEMLPQKIKTMAVEDVFQEDTSHSLSQPLSSSFSSSTLLAAAVSERVSSEQEQQETSHKSTNETGHSSTHSTFNEKAKNVSKMSQQHVTNGCMSSSKTSIHLSETTAALPEHYPHLPERVQSTPNIQNKLNNSSKKDLCSCSSMVVTQSNATGQKVVNRLVADKAALLSPTDSQSTNNQLNATTSV